MSEAAAEDLPAQFRRTAALMRDLAAPLSADLAGLVAADLEAGGPSAVVLQPYLAARPGEFVPLRLLAAVHRAVLRREAPALAVHYPTVGGTPPASEAAWAACRAAFLDVLVDRRPAVAAALESYPQTNEVGRTAGLLGVLRVVEDRFGVPVRLHELGSSAGLHLRADAYLVEPAGVGDPGSPVVLPGWAAGEPYAPGPGPVRVVERRGCDLAPVDPVSTEGRLLLTSYVWPDHLERFERLRAALDVAAGVPAVVVAQDAAAFVAGLRREPGTALVLWHSAMWMYLDPATRASVSARMAELGADADPGSPVVHVALEIGDADVDDANRFLLTVRSWPDLLGGEPGTRWLLARTPAHGVPVRWQRPEPLPG